jgi:hypothetical protein
MIGTRDALAVAVALAFVVFGLGPGAPRPEVAIHADELVSTRAIAAVDPLGELLDDLETATETSRSAATAIVAGDRSPGELLQEAADLVADAGEIAVLANARAGELESARLARDPTAEPMPEGVAAADLASISAQLEATVAAADEFARMRRRAVNVPEALGAALAALGDGDLETAEGRLAAAADDQAAVAGWDVDFAALPVWVAATDATIDAVERLLAAVRNGDQPAAERAAADFAALGDEATRADRALQITISEGGGGVATAPLARLSEARERASAQHEFVTTLLAVSGR